MGLIISFDPGGCSGCCVAEHSNGRDFQLLQSLEYSWNDRFKIFNLIYSNKAKIKAIVIEEYRLFENKITLHSQIGSEIPSARIIGIIELSAQLSKLNCIHYQKPSNIHGRDPQTGKPNYSLSIIPEHKKLILPSKHCLDAYFHMRYYVLTTARKEKYNGK
jgi:hypothetical protein